VGLRDWSGEIRPLEQLSGRRVTAFAAIGNPAAFRATLAAAGADVADFQTFADHHRYAAGDLESLAAHATRAGAELVVTTLKDLVKLRCNALAGIPLVALEIAIDFTSGGDLLESLVGAATVNEPNPDRERGPVV
jgi:tetraacyldisaccharide 4'-kinase